jgi:hypothetical protein
MRPARNDEQTPGGSRSAWLNPPDAVVRTLKKQTLSKLS